MYIMLFNTLPQVRPHTHIWRDSNNHNQLLLSPHVGSMNWGNKYYVVRFEYMTSHQTRQDTMLNNQFPRSLNL